MGKGGDGSKDLPKNWPQDIIYLTAPVYSPQLTKAQLQAIRQPPAAGMGTGTRTELETLPPDLRRGPSPLVKNTPISDPAHPARGQYGLFASRDLRPGTLIVPYLGEVHPGTAADARSDYDLWLDRDADVAVDAARMGNEARFVNDYRGVPGRSRPNAEFREVWDARAGGERGMAFFVLPAGRKGKQQSGKSAGIAKGEEILVSYGKGFWGVRGEEGGTNG